MKTTPFEHPSGETTGPSLASPRPYGGQSALERTTKRKEQFLDAGLELIGKVGFKGTSVRGLCRQAQLTDRYFYESFSSVEDVLIEVYQREITRMAQCVGQALQSIGTNPSVSEMARPALAAFFESVKDPRVAKLVWFEILGVSDRVNQIYQQALRDFGELLLSQIKPLYKSSTLTQCQEELMVMSLVGAISQSCMSWIISGFKQPVDDLIHVNVLLLEGLAARLGL